MISALLIVVVMIVAFTVSPEAFTSAHLFIVVSSVKLYVTRKLIALYWSVSIFQYEGCVPYYHRDYMCIPATPIDNVR